MNTELAQIINTSDRIVFFGGAGVSTESCIPDFRSGGGLYSQDSGLNYSPEEVLSHSFYLTHTAQFYDYYRRNLLYPQARPNRAHLALAELEDRGRLSAVITQNIDGLHQAAGSHTVHELHGSVKRNTCLSCGRHYGWQIVLDADTIPICECGGIVKPDVVLYEESLDERVIEASIEALRQADTLIIGGTSLVVYPAAGLIHYFHGDHLVLINKEATPADRRAELVIHAPIGSTLGEVVGIDG